MKVLDDFIAHVLDRDPECTAEDIADMIWLARRLPAATKGTLKSTPATDQKPPENLGLSLPESSETTARQSEPQPASSPDPKPSSASRVSGPDSQPAQQRVRVPAAPGLEQVLQFAGSLRPLRRLAPSRFDSVIDYEQTARRSADEKIWVPVLRPKLDRALSLALVLDQASSMNLWRPLVRDLRRLLVERGNFRQCRLWSLHTDSDSKPVLTAGWQSRTDQISRDPREVLAPGGQLVIIVSDCIAPVWYRSDMLSTLLEPWGRHSHLVVFNPLGEYLWPRTRLGLATPVQLSAPFPAASNINLRIHEFDLLETAAPTGLKLPVVELDPSKLQQWAKMVMAREGMTASGFIVSSADVDLSPLPVPVGQDERPPEQILAAFWQVASSQARRLLSLLAMTPIPVNLPMLRLLRSVFLPQCRPTHEAEALYSGLFQPVTKESSAKPDPEQILYELAQPVRRLLLDAAPVYDMKRLWNYIEHQDHGLGDTFQAILADPGKVAWSSGQGATPFLNIPLEIARRIWPEKFIEEKYEYGSLRDRPQRPPITLSELEGPTVSLPPALQTLWDIICAAERPTELNLLPDTLAEIPRHAPRNLTEYRLSRIADWSQPRYELDKRFVQLTLLLDKGEDAQGPRWVSSRQFQDLREVLQETLDTPALVLLGPPGSGKSTLLRRLEWDLAVDALRDPTAEQARLSFFVPLNQYQPARSGDPLPEPQQWLAERWTQRFPGLPPIDDWLRAGRSILLLDALDETSASRDVIGLWKAFLQEMTQTYPGNRFIFSCRSLDYSSSLSSRNLTVPHVRIESLSDAQVGHFLQVYSPHGDTLWRHLKGTLQLDLYRTPVYLKMLVNQVDAEGHIPGGRAALFTSFVRQALQRERRADNTLFQPDELLTQRDCKRLVQHRWRDAYDLPDQGVLIPKLAALAYCMQQQRIATEASQVRIDYDQALAILDHAKAETILKAGVDLGVLDIDVDDVLYIHQFMQEYFAARYLAAAPDAERVRTDWRADRIDPSLAQVLAKLADADPLPPALATGWEETTVLAVTMSANPEAFVTALMETNLPLAGRCAAQPDVRISEELKTRIRWALVERTQDSAADLRARIAAGLSLGPLGDPRFEQRKGPYGDYLLPPLVAIPGGTYTLGSEEGETCYTINDKDRERPIHQIQLAPFQIGKSPVTNAEWKLFMEGGGYYDERWWDTEVAKAWRRGEGTAEGAKQPYREYRKWIQDHLDSPDEYKQLTAEEIKEWTKYAQMSDEEFEALLDQDYPPGRQTQPALWNDNAFNNLAQPVVGICWYEARAYCVWLSAQTGQSFRLPTEAEWEAAARSGAGHRYAYGDDFDETRCNTFETHIRRTTPIGVFPDGETLEGLVDITGNTWDWTSSLYRPYPYEAGDGREDSTAEGRRVVRGGAWRDTAIRARTVCRDHSHPVLRFSRLGVRVVVSLSSIL